jgi:AcrR family transcriptional regulator
MEAKNNQTSSKEVVLNAAEQLFTARGYTAVTLKHVANKLGIKQASLYYHFPKGKEDMYVDVMLRHLEKRYVYIESLIASSDPTLESCLFSIGVWLIQQQPINAGRMIMSDLPELSPDKAAQLELAIYQFVFAPIEALFNQYRHRFKEEFRDLGFIGGTFLSSLEALYVFRKYGSDTDEALVSRLIALILKGTIVN